MDVGKLSMDVSKLKRFIIVVECGSLGKAAERLNISQPGLTKNIQQLENSFGARLLDRGPQGVVATTFGQAVYLSAKKITAELCHLENERVALSSGLVGSIAVGVARGTGFLEHLIPAATAKFLNSRHSIHLRVLSGVGEELVSALRQGTLDFAITVLDTVGHRQELEEEVLFHDRCGLFVDACHPLSRRAAVELEDLARYGWLFSTDVVSLRDGLTELAHSKGLRPPPIVVDSNSVLYLRSALIGSEFIGLLTMDSVEDAVRGGNLVELVLAPDQRAQLGIAALERPVGFLVPAAGTLPPVALALMAEIRQLCPKFGYPSVANSPAHTLARVPSATRERHRSTRRRSDCNLPSGVPVEAAI